MSALDLLEALLSFEGRPFRRRAFRKEPLEICVRLGFVADAGLVARAVCDLCDEPHEGDVRKTEKGAEIFCRRHGWWPVPLAEVAASRLDEEKAARAVAEALGASGRVRLIGGGLWALGRFALRPDLAAVGYLAPRADSASRLAAAKAALASEPAADLSVILAAKPVEPTAVFAWPKAQIVALSDVLRCEGAALGVDLKALAAIAAPPPAPSRKGGRPRAYDAELKPLIAELWPGGHSPPEWRTVESAFRTRFPNLNAPSKSTIKRALDEEAALRGVE